MSLLFFCETGLLGREKALPLRLIQRRTLFGHQAGLFGEPFAFFLIQAVLLSAVALFFFVAARLLFGLQAEPLELGQTGLLFCFQTEPLFFCQPSFFFEASLFFSFETRTLDLGKAGLFGEPLLLLTGKARFFFQPGLLFSLETEPLFFQPRLLCSFETEPLFFGQPGFFFQPGLFFGLQTGPLFFGQPGYFLQPGLLFGLETSPLFFSPPGFFREPGLFCFALEPSLFCEAGFFGEAVLLFAREAGFLFLPGLLLGLETGSLLFGQAGFLGEAFLVLSLQEGLLFGLGGKPCFFSQPRLLLFRFTTEPRFFFHPRAFLFFLAKALGLAAPHLFGGNRVEPTAAGQHLEERTLFRRRAFGLFPLGERLQPLAIFLRGFPPGGGRKISEPKPRGLCSGGSERRPGFAHHPRAAHEVAAAHVTFFEPNAFREPHRLANAGEHAGRLGFCGQHAQLIERVRVDGGGLTPRPERIELREAQAATLHQRRHRALPTETRMQRTADDAAFAKGNAGLTTLGGTRQPARRAIEVGPVQRFDDLRVAHCGAKPTPELAGAPRTRQFRPRSIS